MTSTNKQILFAAHTQRLEKFDSSNKQNFPEMREEDFKKKKERFYSTVGVFHGESNVRK